MRLLERPWRLARLRQSAHHYADHGWPVVPGAVLADSRFSCGPGCPTVACHPGIDHWERAASTDHAQVTLWWRRDPHAVLLATGRAFDAIDLPAWLGRATVANGLAGGPILVTPTGRWLFLVRRGALTRPELAAHFGVVVHAAGSWLPAPPTLLVEGRVRWRIPPEQTGWELAASGTVQAHAVAALRERSGPVAADRAACTPVTRTPIARAAVARAPVAGTPVTRTAVTGTPVTGGPVTGDPVTGDPVTDAPVTRDPVAPDRAAQDPGGRHPVNPDPVAPERATVMTRTPAGTAGAPGPVPNGGSHTATPPGTDRIAVVRRNAGPMAARDRTPARPIRHRA